MDTSDYGTLLKPPSDLASTIVSAMTDEERSNFWDLLGHLQSWHESASDEPGLIFHPEVRTALWGAALAKIADHFREIGQPERALFFMGAAWNISKHPVFAFNAGLLSLSCGDLNRARTLFSAYLSDYANVLRNPSLMLVDPTITPDELESIAASARGRIAELQAGFL